MKLHRCAWILFLLPAVALAIIEDPVDLIRRTTERVLVQLIEIPDIKSKPEKLSVLVEKNIVPAIDFVRLSRLTLGKHWRSATAEQRERFTDEFKQLLIRTYSTSLAEYSGQRIQYLELNTKAKDKRSTVRTSLHQAGGPPVTVDYSLYRSRDGWKIYDLTIEGVSLAVNYRSSFGREIRSRGLAGLIQLLTARNQ